MKVKIETFLEDISYEEEAYVWYELKSYRAKQIIDAKLSGQSP